MKLFQSMERKFGKYAISELIKYFIMLRIIGAVIGLINPGIYTYYLCLNIEAVLHGQVWRLLTFIIEPINVLGMGGANILFFAIELYLYYLFGMSLEKAWGKFVFNLYFLSGILFSIIGGFIIYFALGMSAPIGLDYIYKTMFFAFVTLYPDMQFNLWFVIPIKAKWLAWFYAIMTAWPVVEYIMFGIQTSKPIYFAPAIAILVSFANFFIYFFVTKGKRYSPKQMRRKNTFKSQINRPVGITKHKCAICGRTEKDDENLEFRFCSKCEGNYEYCSEHLFTHNHVHRH